MRKIKIPQYEVVIELEEMGEFDNVYLMQIELHNALKAARMQNIPHKYSKLGDRGLIQFFIPQEKYDEEFLEEIAKAICGSCYVGITKGIKG